jgi:hypothetical protein
MKLWEFWTLRPGEIVMTKHRAALVEERTYPKNGCYVKYMDTGRKVYKTFRQLKRWKGCVEGDTTKSS